MTGSLIPAVDRPYEDIDITSIAFWGRAPEIRDKSFAKLRAKGGVTWHPPVEAQPVPAVSPGFWACSTNEAVVEVSRDPARFSSAGTSPSIYEAPAEILAAVTGFAPMDPPQHTRYRRLVSQAFTPKQLQRIDALITNRARIAVDNLIAAGPCDFVELVSDYMPSQVIADMVGVDDLDMRDELVRVVTSVLVFGDPGVRPNGENPMEFFARMLFDLLTAGQTVLAEKRKSPGDDLITSLMNTEVDGERLTDQEIISFFCLMVIAGIDTTRNTLSFAIRALTDFPEQRTLLLEDLPGRIDAAVIEMARWASPVSAFVRRATRDTELNGVPIAEGDRVAMWYLSANRDETVFDRPWEFDIMRDNTHQVAWGGGGPHYCMGANLAKVETKALITELLTRVPTIRSAGEATYASSPFVNSIEHQMCEWDS